MRRTLALISMLLSARAAIAAAESATAADSLAPSTGERASLTSRATRTVGNFFSDAGVIATSPLRLKGRGWIWTGVVLGVGAAIYANDQAISDASIRNREDPVFKAVLDVGDAIEPVGFMGKTNPFYLAALGAGYAFDVPLLRTIPTEILESHLLAGGVRNVGKTILGRRRPFENEGPYHFGFAEGTSFPSGHTSVIFELATIASMNARSRPVTLAAYSLATTLAIQRVESHNHWPSDVFIAAVYGTLVARTVVQQNERRAREGSRGFSLLPEVSSAGRVSGVRLTTSF